MTSKNIRTGAVGLGFGATVGTPLGIMANYALSVSPWHWYVPGNEVMVGAVSGFVTIIAGGLGEIAAFHLVERRASE